ASACGTKTCSDPGIEPFSSNTTFTLSTGKADKRVCWRFCDEAGNATAVAYQNITLGTYLPRPQPVLTALSPDQYEALSRESLSPKYPVTVTGRGIAIDTQIIVGDFQLTCNTGGQGADCQPDANGLCGTGSTCQTTCAESCTVNLPDTIMRNAGTYVVRLFTPDPVVNGLNTSADTDFFYVTSPLPVITRIEPRGVTRTAPGGVPEPTAASIKVWGSKFMDNAQFRLGSNYGTVSVFTELSPTDRYVEVSIPTTGLYYNDLVDYALIVVNPSPGGGEAARPFGINPDMTLCSSNSVCTSNLRWTKTLLPSERSLGQLYGYDTLPEKGFLWRGGTAIRAVDTSGRVLGRVRSEHAAGGFPFLQLTDFDGLQFEDNVGTQPLVLLKQSTKRYSSVTDPRSTVRRGDGTFPAGAVPAPATGLTPYAVTLGDLDGDGDLDAAVVANDDSELQIFRWGTSSYSLAAAYPTGAGPRSVLLVDLDGDGDLDTVTANQFSTNISIRHNDGLGNLGPRIDLSSTSCTPTDVAAGDVDRDGTVDLFIVCMNSSNARLRRGHGDGTFDNAITVSVGDYSPVIVDVNNDGWPDLIASRSQTSSTGEFGVALNNGDGTFAAATTNSHANIASPRGMVLADVNEDGALDALVTGYNADLVAVFRGDGRGGFTYSTAYAAGNGPFDIYANDFNGDGRVDMAVAVFSDDTLRVRLGTGSGTFGAETVYTGGGDTPRCVAGGDIDADGVIDLVTSNINSHELNVFMGNQGDRLGMMYMRDVSTLGSDAWGVAYADIDRDGNLDAIIAPYSGSGGVRAESQGTGVFTWSAFAMQSSPSVPTFFDVDGDGITDMLQPTNDGDGQVAVQMGIGDGTFGSATLYEVGDNPATGNAFPKQVVVADFDRDRRPDFAVTNSGDSSVTVYRDNDVNLSGAFSNKLNIATTASPWGLALDDVDNDGDVDLVVAIDTGIQVLRNGNNNGTGFSMVALTEVTFSGGAMSAEPWDIDGDGDRDLIASGDSGITILINNGSGVFTAGPPAGSGVLYTAAVGDLDGDGLPEVVAPRYNYDEAVFMRWDGSAWSSPRSYSTGAEPIMAGMADFNRDGALDYMVTARDTDQVLVRLSPAPGRWTQELTDMPAPSVSIANGATYNTTVHQAMQYADTTRVRVRLRSNSFTNTTLTLFAPNGLSTSVPKTGCTNGTDCVILNDITTTGMVDAFLPEGDWTLRVANSSGNVVTLTDFAVITNGYPIAPRPGFNRMFAETLPLYAGKRYTFVKGSNLGNGDHTSTTTDCTKASTEQSGSGNHWYQFTLPAANGIAVDVMGGFDTILGLYSGACSSGTGATVCNDDAGLVTGDHFSRIGNYVTPTYVSVAAGTWCLMVSGDFAGSLFNEGDYIMYVRFQNAL
ncbi:MAG: VCBS repeat-containing protein, partial [Pseudomonadota bacterium]